MSQVKKKVGSIRLSVYFCDVLLTSWVILIHFNRAHFINAPRLQLSTMPRGQSYGAIG